MAKMRVETTEGNYRFEEGNDVVCGGVGGGVGGGCVVGDDFSGFG